MYITINNTIGKKRIDLSYPIKNFDSSKKIAVITMFNDNIQYEIGKPHTIMVPISDTKKLIPSKTYAGRELISMLEVMVELAHFEADDQVIKKNMLRVITEMVLNLDEFNNSNNLENGKPSATLLTYHLTSKEDFTCFEPVKPQYKKLRNGEHFFDLENSGSKW